MYGDSYRENLEKYDIDLTYLTEGESPTGVATVLVEPDGTNRIVIVPGANFELTPRSGSGRCSQFRTTCCCGST
ncbi:MAG: PfkB family carbohydrate kinase [Acidimicrobiales bacterium]